MPRQHDLFGSTALTINPVAGLTEPRLWIRRLVLWQEPGGEKIREIKLRPGLNIIWSPDGADSNTDDPSEAIGHGAGKTLLCRLIRYCLGETRFATEAQRERIATRFPDGMVGAEVILDGVCWAIVRPIGLRRRHMAVPNGNLDDIAAGEGTSTGMEPFINAVEQSIITPGLAALVRPQADGPAWPIALAWLTRDQDCRFADLLEWRSPASDSNAPVPASGQKGPRLEALRAFLMAITPDEQQVRIEAEKYEEEQRKLEQNVGYLQWQINRTRTKLIADLGMEGQNLPDMPLLLDVLRKVASERVAAATKLPAGGNAELATAREEYKAAQFKWENLDRQYNKIRALIPVEEQLLSQMRGEIPGLFSVVDEAANPICPICEVPIDRALDEGCKLSHKIPDPDECRARFERRKHDVEAQQGKLVDLKAQIAQLRPELAIAEQARNQCHDRVTSIENARDAREGAWYSARKLDDRVERLAEAFNEHEAAVMELDTLTKSIEAERKRLGIFRERQSLTFGRMSKKFDPVVRILLGHNAKSHIKLLARSIALSVDMGGDRTTAAIDSLKVLAFDLAALCLSIEGNARIPAFLLHDSPREADLGLSIYHKLFRLIRELEEQTDQPLFQYIITSTTQPPPDLARDPWLRLTLDGTRSTDRLLSCDL